MFFPNTQARTVPFQVAYDIQKILGGPRRSRAVGWEVALRIVTVYLSVGSLIDDAGK